MGPMDSTRSRVATEQAAATTAAYAALNYVQSGTGCRCE
jgi:hypothetical protein